MISRIVNTLRMLSQKERSTTYKIITLICGGMLFLVVFPFILINAGAYINHYLIGLEVYRLLEMLLAWFFLGVGIFFLSWAVYAQWAIGQGTPAPVAPTKQLIVEGPYKLSRNPIQLGIILYYLGLGTISDGLASGLIAFFIGFLVGITYHKLIEEKELLLRFGDEYKEYKKKTPFLFPHP